MRINPRTHAQPVRSCLVLQIFLALLITVTIAAQDKPAEPGLQGEGSLKVMTYNMYVGTEYRDATSSNCATFLQAMANLMADVRANDPPARAQAIARQIAATRPHLVSLQEVATWSTGPTPDNLTLEFDYLQLLLDALAALGAQYTPVAALTHFDAIMPIPDKPCSTGPYTRNTWSVAVLARSDLKPEDFSFANVHAAPWAATWIVPIPAQGTTLPWPRGWISADVTYRGKQFRFIGAHLDSRSTSRNILQGVELLTGPADTALPVVVAADLNCDLSNPSDPKYPTCLNFLNAGFVDAWNSTNPSQPGYTKELPTMTMRGDYVMVRGRFGVQAAVLVGEEQDAMTPSGLWPSNHCGVVGRLQLPGEE